MCKYCDDIDIAFKNGQTDPRKSFMQIYELLLNKIENAQLTIYAGDCKFKDMLTIIDEEIHYTSMLLFAMSGLRSILFFGSLY